MKKKPIIFGWSIRYSICVFISVLLFYSSSHSQNLWELQQQNLSGSNFSDICFVNDSVGWIVGSDGIAVTYNGGKVWQKQSGDAMNYVSFSDAENGFAAYSITNNGLSSISLRKTTDGGKTWTNPGLNGLSSAPGFSLTAIDNIYAVSAKWAYLSGTSSGISNLYRTTNGGLNWTRLTSCPGAGKIFFKDSLNGWVGYQANIYRTTDSGFTWIASQVQGTTVNDIWFTSLLEGWAGCTPGMFMHTIDGGITWLKDGGIPDTVTITSIMFKGDTGWVAGKKRAVSTVVSGIGPSVYWTTNRGVNWNAVAVNPGTNPGEQVIWGLNDKSSIVIDKEVDFTCNVYKTTNVGNSWFNGKGSVITDYQAVDAVDSLRAWAIGKSGGAIVATSDGGMSWTKQWSGSAALTDVKMFQDGTAGWATAGGGTVLRTVNSGTTWDNISTGSSTDNLRAVWCFDNDKAIVVGGGGLIKQTINGGESWNTLTAGLENYNDVFFVSNDVGWIGGDNGALWVTTNGGAKWDQQVSPINFNVQSLSFLDELRGWAVGGGTTGGGTVLKTVDGGFTWVQVNLSGIRTSGGTYYDVQFVDASNGWIVGDYYTGGGSASNASILRTTDGGKTWMTEPELATIKLQLLGVDFVDRRHGWTVGLGGLIMKYNGIIDLDVVSIDKPNGTSFARGEEIIPEVTVKNNGNIIITNAPVVFEILETTNKKVVYYDTLFVTLTKGAMTQLTFKPWMAENTSDKVKYTFRVTGNNLASDDFPINNIREIIIGTDSTVSGPDLRAVSVDTPYKNQTIALNQTIRLVATFRNNGGVVLTDSKIWFEIVKTKSNQLVYRDSGLLSGALNPLVLRQYSFAPWTDSIGTNKIQYTFRAIARLGATDVLPTNDTSEVTIGTDSLANGLDLWALSIDEPTKTQTFIAGQKIRPRASYKNNGTQTITDPNVRFEILLTKSGSIFYREDGTITSALTPGMSIQYFFPLWTAPAGTDNVQYTFRAIARLSGDVFIGNDTTTTLLGKDSVVSVEDDLNTINTFVLLQNFPNPASETTTVRISNGVGGVFELKDILGRILYHRQLHHDEQEVILGVSSLPPGLYQYSFSTGTTVLSRIMTVVR